MGISSGKKKLPEDRIKRIYLKRFGVEQNREGWDGYFTDEYYTIYPRPGEIAFIFDTSRIKNILSTPFYQGFRDAMMGNNSDNLRCSTSMEINGYENGYNEGTATLGKMKAK